QGGFLVAPQQFVAVLIKFLDDETFVRELATKFQVPNAQSLGAPSLDNDPSDADWTSEVGTVNTDELNNMFGKRELRPYDLTKEVKISKKLLQQAQMDPASFVAQRIAYKFGVTQEKAFLIGSGSNQPLGIYTPSADGIDTSRDVIAAAAAVLDGDDFIDTKMSLKGQYHKRAVWTLHREVLKRVMKLQSSQGEYLYQDLRGATPDTILGLPYKLSEFSPSDVSTGKYVAALGDFSYYWIADAMNFAIQVLTELYARTRQNGYIATASVDGQPVLAEAFARLKMA
ncbi:MAG TPA: phage major capsid protein, partial [Chloroflexia bacterium]